MYDSAQKHPKRNRTSLQTGNEMAIANAHPKHEAIHHSFAMGTRRTCGDDATVTNFGIMPMRSPKMTISADMFRGRKNVLKYS
jgi:hypothetical protein